MSKGFSSGTLKDTAGLKPTRKGYRIRSAGGRLQATDGPFTETKEVVGGYVLVEVASEEQAREVAQQFMELHRVHWPAFECECEVRKLEDMKGAPATQEATAPSLPSRIGSGWGSATQRTRLLDFPKSYVPGESDGRIPDESGTPSSGGAV